MAIQHLAGTPLRLIPEGVERMYLQPQEHQEVPQPIRELEDRLHSIILEYSLAYVITLTKEFQVPFSIPAENQEAFVRYMREKYNIHLTINNYTVSGRWLND